MAHKLKTQNSLLKNITLGLLASCTLIACQETNSENTIVNTAAQDRTESEQNRAASLALSKSASGEIADLMARTDVQAAFADLEAMNAKNITRLIEITEIPAPPFGEDVRAQDYAKRLHAAGLTDVTIDEVGNVIARRKGRTGSKTIALGAHIDTVFPIETDVTVRREGDIFYAPGIGDNSQGLVLMLSLIEVMEKHDLETDADVLFIGTVGEEGLGNLSGMRHLFRDGGQKIDSFIAIDGSNAERIVNKAVGSHRYRVEFSGPGGHSYGAFGRAHPHQALGDAISRFTKAATPITQSGTRSTFSVGRIGGGTSINSIPFTSWMEVDMRSINQDKINALDAVFQQAVQDALEAENARRNSNGPIRVDVKSVGKRPAGTTDENSALVTHAMAATQALGLSPSLTASSTDSNIPMSLGVPAITISRGGISRNAHAPNESWENKDPHIAAQIALLTVLAEATE